MNLPVRFAFLLVFLVALLLRWPLPEPAWLQVDERSFVEFPLDFFGGDLNPHFFNYPTLHFYLCAALDYVWFLLSGSDSLENFLAYRWFVDGFDIFVLARALSTVMSVATVVVVWRIGLRLYGPVAGLGAALFLALMPLHVRFAHLAATDSPAVLWVSLSLLYAVCIVQEGRLRDCLCAGLFVGLAGATKYPGALVAIPVGMSALLRWPTWRNPGLVLAAAASLLTFAVTSPYTWLDPGAFWTGLSQMGREHLLSDMHAGGEGRGSDGIARELALWIRVDESGPWCRGDPMALAMATRRTRTSGCDHPLRHPRAVSIFPVHALLSAAGTTLERAGVAAPAPA